jgi:probable HAF family extracellular repeat protein
MVPSCLHRGARFAALVALAAGALAAQAAGAGTVTYHLTDLGADAHPYGINTSGQIAGYVVQDKIAQAAIWRDGAWQPLQSPALPFMGIAEDINDAGAVSGMVYDPNTGNQNAATWTSAGALVSFGPPGSASTSINKSGVVVGVDWPGGFIWRAGTFTTVPAPPGSSGIVLQAIDGRGEIAASVYGPNGTSSDQLALYDPHTGTWQMLGTLGGTAATALGISRLGHITGSSLLTENSAGHAYLYDGVAMKDLGTLGGPMSAGEGLNNHDVVVGESQDERGLLQAFVWRKGTMTALHELVDNGAGWRINLATGVNDAGAVVGTGIVGGVVHGYLLTPVQP